MTPDERRHGTSLSGWCIDGHHPACTYPPCPCECHNGANVVESQGCSTYTRGASTEAAPAGASTPVGPGPRPSDEEGLTAMIGALPHSATPLAGVGGVA